MARIIVVGSNHGGTAAIDTILDNYKDNEVIVFDKNSNISFLGCGTALMIGKQISGSYGLFYSDKETLEKKGAKVHLEAYVYHIDFYAKKVYVRFKGGKKMEAKYDKLILATGSNPVIPDVEGKNLKNVQRVKTYQDAQDIMHKLKNDYIENVTVVGGGYIGVELAEAFEKHGKKVTLIDRNEKCLSGYYDEDFSEVMEKNLALKGINLALGENLTEVMGFGKVQRVVTDKNQYRSDMLVLAAGFEPNVELGHGRIEQFYNGAYIVDRHQETSIKDVYAVGDCATVYDNAIDEKNHLCFATNAVRSGIVAGHNVCGMPMESEGVQGSNGVSIYDFKMVSTGLTMKRAREKGIEVESTDYIDTQKAGFMEIDNPEVKIKIVYMKESRVVVGAQMASTYDMTMGLHMLSLAIQEKLTIDRLGLLDMFFLPHFNQPYNYIVRAAPDAK